MSILIFCPDCNAKIRAPTSILGRQVRCPKCEVSFTATADDGPEPELPPDPEPDVPPEPDPLSELEPDPYPVSQPAPPPARPTVARPEPPRRPAPPPPEPDEEAWDDEPDRETAPPHSGFGAPPNPIVDLLVFRTMISPLIIQFVFWLGVVGCILFGGFTLITGIGLLVDGRAPAGFALIQGFLGIAIILFGPLVVRINCELPILMFRIYDTLKDIHAATEKHRRQG